jgi:hypothetical protein
MKKSSRKQRKLRKSERGITTKSLVGRGFKHQLTNKGLMPIPEL